MPHFCALQQHLSVKASSETILPLTESCCILFPKDTIQYISIKSELLRLLICAPASPELNYLLILIASNTKNLYICTYVYMHKQVCVYACIYLYTSSWCKYTHTPQHTMLYTQKNMYISKCFPKAGLYDQANRTAMLCSMSSQYTTEIVFQ